MPTQCIALNRDGNRCGAQASRGELCRWHDPALEAERGEWRQRGGVARSNKERARKQLQRDAMTLSDVQGVLCATLRRVVDGETEPGVGSAAATLGRAIAAISTAADLEERITELERIAARQTGRAS